MHSNEALSLFFSFVFFSTKTMHREKVYVYYRDFSYHENDKDRGFIFSEVRRERKREAKNMLGGRRRTKENDG